jgi:hypothetical protein
MKMFKFTKILTVVAMIVAMAVPALANFSGSKTVASGETWAADGDIARDSNTDITINVGGSMTGGEFQASDGSGYTFDMDIFGAADIEQLKVFGPACTVVVGNGTNAATLEIVEGLLGKTGNATITINDLSTMIVSGNWDSAYKVDAGLGTNTDTYIDLLGSGTLVVNASITESWFDKSIKGNGTLNNWVKTYDAGGFDGDGSNTYTAIPEPATMSLLAIGGLALIRRRRRS